MALYEVGQPIRLMTTVVDIDGDPADPTDISLTVAPPSGANVTYDYSPGTIVRTGVGEYYQELSNLTLVGHYTYAWLATGASAGAESGAFDLINPLEFAVVSIEDARAYLRLVNGSDVDTDDARLVDIIRSVTANLITLCGPIVATAYSEIVYANGSAALGHGPVREITGVTAVTTGAATVDPDDLVILPGDVVATVGTSAWVGWYTVDYTAGRDEVPADIRGAALDWVLHRWRQSQAHSSATYGEPVGDFSGPPNAVLNQIRHYLLHRAGI